MNFWSYKTKRDDENKQLKEIKIKLRLPIL